MAKVVCSVGVGVSVGGVSVGVGVGVGVSVGGVCWLVESFDVAHLFRVLVLVVFGGRGLLL